MPKGFSKVISVIFGAIISIIGLFGTPSAVLSNDWSSLILFTALFFGGIWILGWALKE
ncbi:MAG: hypothetical protein QXM31_04110 [Candidatus Woesearchaeota archaeon]